MNEIVPFEDGPSMGASLMAVIGKAASDPRVDIGKMMALLEMQERIVARDALSQFNEAMSIVNKHDLRVGKAGTASLGGKGSYRFARWEDMDEVIRPLLRSAGMWLSFDSKRETDGGMTISGTLSHAAGHSVTASIYLPIDSGPGRNPLQQMGSTISYGKRYTAEMLLNIVREDEDTDGHPVQNRVDHLYPHRTPERAPSPKPELSFVKRADQALTAEQNGTKWLALLGKILQSCETMEQVSQIRTLPNVIAGSKAAPTAVRSIIAENFTRAVDRLSPQPDPEPEIEVDPPHESPAFDAANIVSAIKDELAGFSDLAVLEAWAKGAGKMALDDLKQQSPKEWQRAVSLIDECRISLGG